MSVRCVYLLLALLGLLSGGMALAQDYDALRAGVVRVQSKAGRGTGFIVRRDSDGVWIVTASHVVEGDPRPKVEFYKHNRETVAEVKHQEAGDARGLALLKVSQNLPENLAALSLADGGMQTDDEVVVIGFPRGAGPWATINAHVAARDGRDFTLDGNVDEGASGGPVFKEGQVVGMVTMMNGKYGLAASVSIFRQTLEGWGVVAAAPDLSPSASFSTNGGAAREIKNCRIEVGSYTVHFTIMQPLTSGMEEFCGSLPSLGPSNLIIDYDLALHQMEVAFEVTKEPGGNSLFKQPLAKHSNGVISQIYNFEQSGKYLMRITLVNEGHRIDAHLPITVGER